MLFLPGWVHALQCSPFDLTGDINYMSVMVLQVTASILTSAFSCQFCHAEQRRLL